MAGARARHRATPPLSLPACPPLLASMPWTTPRLSPALSHSPPALPSSPSLSLSRPNTTIAAVRHSSRLRPPLAPPTSSGAPPRLPLPPPPLHESPEALHRRHVAVPLFGLRPPSPTNSPSPARPRARFDAHCNRGELRHRFPLFSPSFPHRSFISTTAEPPPSPRSPSTQLR